VINETIDIPAGYMYLVYGGLTIGATGVVNNYGRVVIINGNLATASNGQFNNLGGPGSYLTASFLVQKIVKTFSAIKDMGITVSHNLNTQDFTYTLKDGYNFLQANVEISSFDPSNMVIVTCATAVSIATITFVG
jgi:hypothetical protein